MTFEMAVTLLSAAWLDTKRTLPSAAELETIAKCARDIVALVRAEQVKERAQPREPMETT